MVRRLALLIVLSLAAPSAAHAAEVSVTGGVLRYKATPGKTSYVIFTETGAGVVEVTTGMGDDDGLTPIGPDCVLTTTVVCSKVASAAIDLGDLSDRATATYGDRLNPVGLKTIPALISGGDGSDAIVGGLRADKIDGGAGSDDLDGSAGGDTIDGGDGNDTIAPNTGDDSILGGDGIDTVSYGLRVAPTYSLDGLANDGDANEHDLIGTDVENISAAASSGVATLIGDGHANRLTVTDGRADITGGDGGDVLEGGPLDDTIHARDGAPDTVICNGGTDTVEADTIDTVSSTCEAVSTITAPGGAFDDRPPAIAWVLPGANASLSANAASKLTVNAADDRGLTKVQFFDDDRLLCEVTAAPFDCGYAPRGGDVGRDTLIAVAVDGAGQTTSAIRVVTVRRFSSPGLTLALTPSRDRKPPYSYRATGRLQRPTTVSPSQGCSGRVTITAKRGTKTVQLFRTPLSRTCEYATTVRFRSRLASRLRLIARFDGNDILAARAAPSRTVRLG